MSQRKSPITPRDYQTELVKRVIDYWLRGGNHGLVVVPTGGGKSLAMAMVVAELRERYPSAQILCTAHRAELIKQNAAALAAWAPELSFGICSAELGENCLSPKRVKLGSVPPVVLAGIMSIKSAAKLKALGPRHIIIVDEAQMIAHRDNTVYRKVVEHINSITPDMKLLGATATPFRLGSGRLDEDYGKHKAIFERVIYEKPIKELLDEGYLCEVVPPREDDLARIDVGGVSMRNDEFDARELEAASNVDEINRAAVAQIARLGYDRKGWLTFASGVEHAQALGELLSMFRITGIVTADKATTGFYTDGRFVQQSRDIIIGAYKDRKLTSLINVNVLTEGFDAPHTDLIACLRATASQGLWYQIIGRGMRLFEGKSDCLLLDFARNAGRLGPIDQMDGRKTHGAGRGKAPQKECPSCHETVHASYGKCPYCDHEFPPPGTKLEDKPSFEAILSHQLGADHGWRDVTDMIVRKHQKKFAKGAKPTLAILYECGMCETYTRYLSFDAEYSSVPARMSREWWRMVMQCEPPKSVEDGLALANKIPMPKRILVQKNPRNPKYWNVQREDYKG